MAVLGVFAVLASDLCGAAPAFLIGRRDRVVIYGDSITCGVAYQYYPRYIEAYVRTRYPDWAGEIWNRGVSGDGAGNLERFREDCLALEPDVVLFNMGMNDAGLRPSVAASLRSFVTNVTAVAAAARDADARLQLVLISPILYETRVNGTRSYYPWVLRRFAEEERDLARRLGLPFIDLNREYGETLGLTEALFPGTFTFSGDGIHPTTMGGHLFIAVHILKGLGAGDELAMVHLDARKGRIAAARGAKVRRVRLDDAGGLTFERTLKALPFPVVTETGGVVYRDRAIACVEEIEDAFNADRLRVTSLPAGAYALRIDGREVATFDAEALADGINLSRFYNTPDQEQAVAVSEAVGRKQMIQARLWRLNPATAAAEREALEAECSKAVDEIWRLCRPVPREMMLVPVPGVTVDRYRSAEQMVGIKGPAVLTCDVDGAFHQAVTVAVTNLSTLSRRVELLWDGPGADPDAVVTNLPAAASCAITFELALAPGAQAPRLLVRHLPVDLSFPAVVQTYQPALSRSLAVPHCRTDTVPDGRLVEWDGDFAAIDFEPCFTAAVRAQRQGPADCGAVAKLCWNERGLALGVAVRDQDHVNHFTDDRAGWDDALTVSLAGKSFTFVLTTAGPALFPERAAQDGVVFGVRREGLSMVYEAIIPWTAAGVGEVVAGCAYPFNITISDRDRDESHRIVNWSGSAGSVVAGTIRLQK